MRWLQQAVRKTIRSRALSGALIVTGFVAVMAPAASGQVVFNEVRYMDSAGRASRPTGP